MAWVATPLLLGLTLFTISTAHGSPSPTLPQDSEATITVASEIIVVIPADTILDSTTIKLGSAGVSVDGHIVSADVAYDLLVNGSVIFEGQTGVFATSTTTTLRTTNSGRSSSSSILAESTSNSNAVGNTVISSATSLASSSLQPWRTGSRGSLSTNTGYVVANGTVSALSSNLRLNSTATFPDISSPSPVPTWSSTNFAPSQPYTVAPAATSSSPGISSFAQKSIPLVGSITNVSPSSSPLRPITTVSIAPSASSNKAQPMFSSTLINNSTGSQTSFGPLTRSQSVSSQSLKTGSGPSLGLAISANTSSGALVLGPGNQPNTITSGPSMAVPTVSWNPTGSAASSQGILLVGAIFRITDEAKTLTDILKDDRPKESFISKIKGADNEVLRLVEGVNPSGSLPSYDGSCLDGTSILNIFEDLECLKSGLDKVIELLGTEPPDVPKLEVIFDNLGNLANNLEKEEDDTKTQSSRIKSSSTSFSTLSSSTTVSSTAVAGLDPSPIFDYNQSDDSGPDISDQAMMAFFGDLLSSAIGIGPGLSGFTTSTTASNATLTTTSQPRPASSAVTETSAAAGATTSRATSASSAGRGYNPTSSIISPSHDITVPSAPRSTNPPMSIPVNPPLMCTLL